MAMSQRLYRVASYLVLVYATLNLSGCASIAEGVARAVVDRGDEADTRGCWIEGPPVTGMEHILQEQERASASNTDLRGRRQLKALMVHGVGDHFVGYGTRLESNLARALNLDLRVTDSKLIELSNPLILADSKLGTLRVTRYTNKDETREFLFYELTWTPIVEEEKMLLNFDKTELRAHRRASINHSLKVYSDSRIPDPFIYFGVLKEPIQVSVGQSLCWAMSKDWEDLPNSGKHFCDPEDGGFLSEVENDKFVFLTHSLGSRILSDSLQRLVTARRLVEDLPAGAYRNLDEGLQSLRDLEITIFMLSNQLPLLQLGQPSPEVNNSLSEYCADDGPMKNERFVRKANFIAFSDPNDMLSYVIPPGFADKYIDSRLCPSVSNVEINIAEVQSVFGLGELANPLVAHSHYDADERVIAIITRGVGNDLTESIIRNRCEWLETR